MLPPGYVAEHVDLGYAVTAHRAQGLTVDTAHVVVTGSTTRENLYVAMTRGRDTNIAYVALDAPDDLHLPPADHIDATAVLTAVLQRSGSEQSAHQTISTEQNTWTGIAQLAAEYPANYTRPDGTSVYRPPAPPRGFLALDARDRARPLQHAQPRVELRDPGRDAVAQRLVLQERAAKRLGGDRVATGTQQVLQLTRRDDITGGELPGGELPC